MERITSLQNPRIKNIVKLQENSRERKLQNLIVIEGMKEITLALESGIVTEALYVCPEIFEKNNEVLPTVQTVIEVSKDVFAKCAYRESTSGLILLARPKYLELEQLQLSLSPFIIILEGVEKPGNLGAVLRTADASKADAVIIAEPKTDIFNPNVIRSSLGCVFTTQVIAENTDKIIGYLKENNISVFSAALTARKFYHEVDFTKPSAIVMGTESTGLTDKWLSFDQIKIPMRGKIDSLNVSVSTAVICFEAMRQRGFRS